MSRARLQATRDDDEIRFEVVDAPVTLGRGALCTVTLHDPVVSRQHCKLTLSHNVLVLTDLESSNGTWYDGKRVERRELRPGDRFRIGTTEVCFDELVEATDGGVAGALDDDALLGAQLGGYRIVGELGRGGYAVVYRAQQVQLHREVALKVLRRESGGAAPDRVEAFLREARAAAALNHPCLVQVFDVGEVNGRYYLSMELVRGGSLARQLRASGAMSWREAMPVLRDVGAALECAHAHDMVHRDVKPANVLLTDTGGAKLADLGLAGETGRVGTVQFMAPEQIRGDAIDARTDLYALGCTTWAMLTGSPPFHGGSRKQVLTAHLREDPGTLRGIGVAVPQEFDRLVSRLLAKDMAQRPANAQEVVDVLDRVESGEMPRLRSRRVHRARRRHTSTSSSSAVYALILIVLVAAGAFLAWRYLG